MTSHPSAAGYGPDRTAGPSVIAAYDRLAAAGDIAPDPAQRHVAEKLDGLLRSLSEAKLAAKGSSLGWLFGRKKETATAAPRGLYVWGGVGRGKTMLMDLFFELVPEPRKRRQHFHAFMADVHARAFAARREAKNGGRDPVETVAEAIAEEVRLVCFDEFTVTDIADATILARLFTRLFERGVVLVATSNVVPGKLYEGGLNREHVLPFIALIEKRCEVVHLGSRTDYRLRDLGRAEVYLTPLGREADVAMDRLWTRLTGAERGVPRSLKLLGRSVEVPQAQDGIARFGFEELCARPLGAVDYRAIAEHFHTVFVDHVPVLDYERRNEAKRFIILVDTLYDEGIKLILSAAAEPIHLYRAARGTEAFEFDRTASRLIEMRSEVYLAAPRRAERAPEAAQ